MVACVWVGLQCLPRTMSTVLRFVTMKKWCTSSLILQLLQQQPVVVSSCRRRRRRGQATCPKFDAGPITRLTRPICRSATICRSWHLSHRVGLALRTSDSLSYTWPESIWRQTVRPRARLSPTDRGPVEPIRYPSELSLAISQKLYISRNWTRTKVR